MSRGKSDAPAGMVEGRHFGCAAQRQRGGDYYADSTPFGVRIGREREVHEGRGHWLTPQQALELADYLRHCAEWVIEHDPPVVPDPHADVSTGKIRPDGLLQTTYGPVHPEEWGN